MNEPPQNGWAPLPAPPPVAPAYGVGAGYYGGPPMVPPVPSKPSGAYKALGIVQIVFGGLGISYALFAIAMVVLVKSWSATAGVYDWPTFAYTIGHACMAVVTGALLIAAGIGVYKAKRWSRVVGITYAILSLAETIFGTAINLLVIEPAMRARLHSPTVPEIQMITLVSTLIGVVVASILPIFTLVALARKSAKEQLDA